MNTGFICLDGNGLCFRHIFILTLNLETGAAIDMVPLEWEGLNADGHGERGMRRCFLCNAATRKDEGKDDARGVFGRWLYCRYLLPQWVSPSLTY